MKWVFSNYLLNCDNKTLQKVVYFCDLLKHSIVFFNKHAIVIGPTPPGTGVRAFATYTPLTIARPTSARLSDPTSLVPSPHMRVMCPSLFNKLTIIPF